MILSSPDHITAAWIDAALSRAGVSAPGDVAAIDVRSDGDRAWSRIARVAVHYRDGTVVAGRPAHLLVKLCGAEGGVFGDSEVRYYRHDYRHAPDAPLPRCFDAQFVADPRRYHLLLEDLSATHASGDHAVIDDAFATALADALAALHAVHWGPRSQATADDVDRWVDHVSQGLEPLLALASEDELPSAWRPRLRARFAGLRERMQARARDPRGMTLVHGDLNPGNLLVPRDQASEQQGILFIDRQPFDWSLTRWLGASDLAYALLPWHEPALARRLEAVALPRYAAQLQARGIAEADAAALRDDYRLSLDLVLAIPVEWCVLEDDRERMRWLWSRQLRRAIAACDHWEPQA